MLKFRNLTVTPDDPVEQWGAEGMLAAIERGGAKDWGKLVTTLDHTTDPLVIMEAREAVDCADPDLGPTRFFRHYLDETLPQRLTDEATKAAAQIEDSRAQMSSLAHR